MGRGKVQLRRIENKVYRQVTFSKRKAGLLKKAHEISVLCDTDVAVIIFSTKGKLYQFATDSSMERILQRYERHSCSERAPDRSLPESNENSCLEHRKLQSKVDDLHRNIRHSMGEDLDDLRVKQLLQLEQQLGNALRLIRSRQAQLMLDTIDDLRREEKSLQEQIHMMENMLHLKDNNMAHQTLEQSSRFFLALPLLNPLLHSGTCEIREVESKEEGRNQSHGRTNCILPHWMPRQQQRQQQ